MSNITERSNFRLVITGGFLLAANAGFIGALSLAGLHSATVTHVTGDIARTSVFIAKLDTFNIVRMSFVWLSFIVGSCLSTMIVSGTKQFEMRRTYGWALLIESFLLWISYMVSNREAAKTGWWYSEYFGAVACGMQNALCTSYSGAIIRTTHMTGTCTDIGIAIGQEIRIRFYLPFREKLYAFFNRNRYFSLQPAQPIIEESMTGERQTVQKESSILWRLKVLIPLLLGYLLGAMIGAFVYLNIGNRALLIPALFVFIVGFLYVMSATFIMTYRKVKTVIPILPDVELFPMKTTQIQPPSNNSQPSSNQSATSIQATSTTSQTTSIQESNTSTVQNETISSLRNPPQTSI